MGLFSKNKKDKLNQHGNIEKASTEMTPEEIDNYCSLMRDILSRKREGFVWMATTDGAKDGLWGDYSKKAEGCLFIHHASKFDVVSNLLENLNIDPLKLAFMEMKRKRGDKIEHHEDCDGHCND